MAEGFLACLFFASHLATSWCSGVIAPMPIFPAQKTEHPGFDQGARAKPALLPAGLSDSQVGPQGRLAKSSFPNCGLDSYQNGYWHSPERVPASIKTRFGEGSEAL